MGNASKVVTRFPPSPTGSLHIGNIRTLLFNYLYTRKHGGEIYLRFEDTDSERSSSEHEHVALDALEALGLDFDHGPFRQSERTEKYTAAIQTLIENDAAYIAEESEDGTGERVVRFRNPNKEITFTDIVRGNITINTTDFGDFVIARSVRNPIYHLTVVVDDLEMGVTHVIRGEDHITSTPRQLLLIEALGGTVPIYAHLPLIVGSDKKKLSKRHGAVTYREFKELGYLPEGILNYLALLGWNPGDDREFFTKEALIETFSLSRVKSSPALFSYEKLDSINRQHMLALSDEEYAAQVHTFIDTDAHAKDHPRFDTIVELIFRDRLTKFSDATKLIENGELDWLGALGEYDASLLIPKESDPKRIKEHLDYIHETLSAFEEREWSHDTLKSALWEYATEHGRGEVLWPLRFALTAQKHSPDPFVVAEILGKESACARILWAYEQL